MQFKDVVTDPGQFRELMGEPPPPCVAKTLSIEDPLKLDRHCCVFIAVLDDKTLAVPDRLGNRRADTFTNVLENPTVGLIFFVPGKSETLRVSGTAKIVRDAVLRDSMAARGKTPDFVLAVDVDEAFFHCSKCIVPSGLWTPEAWPVLDGLPSLAQTMVDAAALPMPVEALEPIIKQDEAERLY